MKLKITSTKTETRSGAKNGRAWSMTNQYGFVSVNEETRRIQILIPEDSSPFAVGEYEIDFDKSCYVNSYGSLTLSSELKIKTPATYTKAA